MGKIREEMLEREWAKYQSKKSDFKEFNTGAMKEVEGKLRMDLIPPEVEKALAEVFTFGTKKYDDRNWEKGIPFRACVGALKRHLNSWLMKEDINEESGLNHMKHVLFWAAALTFFIEKNQSSLDDR